jgi:hypothetical protein
MVPVELLRVEKVEGQELSMPLQWDGTSLDLLMLLCFVAYSERAMLRSIPP